MSNNIHIKIIPQTEEIHSVRTLSNDEIDKVQYELLGDKWRIDKDGKWNLTKFDSVNLNEIDESKFTFKLNIKSDFYPTK